MSRETMSVLIVEDDPQIVPMLGATLATEGYSVLTASNGEEALIAVEEKHPTLVLLDIGLPGMDGFTTCQRIREVSQVAIVMVTGLGYLADRVRGLEVGADAYIAKPFRPAELVARVNAVLRRSSIMDDAQQLKMAS